jgi:Arc/MetJ family transcription regulator
MNLVKKTIELDQEAITRIKTALNTKSEKEAVIFVLRQFDTDIQTDIQLAEATLNLVGKMNIEQI